MFSGLLGLLTWWYAFTSHWYVVQSSQLIIYSAMCLQGYIWYLSHWTSICHYSVLCHTAITLSTPLPTLSFPLINATSSRAGSMFAVLSLEGGINVRHCILCRDYVQVYSVTHCKPRRRGNAVITCFTMRGPGTISFYCAGRLR